ncbi:hypothetical protein F5X99DRAFT_168587 [Biscogniauxia marginata]|nr:hypothetical protein F5X99DRAFT_168587 [Biscogniauxia marginata]
MAAKQVRGYSPGAPLNKRPHRVVVSLKPKLGSTNRSLVYSIVVMLLASIGYILALGPETDRLGRKSTLAVWHTDLHLINLRTKSKPPIFGADMIQVVSDGMKSSRQRKKRKEKKEKITGKIILLSDIAHAPPTRRRRARPSHMSTAPGRFGYCVSFVVTRNV